MLKANNKKQGLSATISDSRKEINSINRKYKNGYSTKRKILIGSFTLISICFLCILAAVFLNIKNEKENQMLVQTYQKEGVKEQFSKEMDELQSSIASYLLLNTTTEIGSFEKVVKELNRDLEKNNFSKLSVTRNTLYKGKYRLNEQGKLIFQFESKVLEPSWASESSYVLPN